MKYRIKEIYKLLERDFPHTYSDKIIRHILTDSRSLMYPDNTLFVALKTSRQDGHQFIPEMYKKGVRTFLVSQIPSEAFPDAIFIEVKDPLRAFQKIAAGWRRHFHIPVIGITGSNGKTIVKEWLFQLLSEDYFIVRSPKSFNSQIGAPLSISDMSNKHQLGIFEAGISQPDEMQHLEKVIQPTFGIFTNIGQAHAEGFENIRQKIREKLQLFQKVELLIYRTDTPELQEEVTRFYKKKKSKSPKLHLFSWTTDKEKKESLVITSIDTVSDSNEKILSVIKGIYKEQTLSLQIPFSDSGSVENAIHCWCMLLYLKVPNIIIQERMSRLSPVAMRLEMIPAIQNCMLINDSYNSDLTSIKVALDFLSHQQQHIKRTLILSDLLQSGEVPSILYKQIAEWLNQKKINRFIGIGKMIFSQKKHFESLPDIEAYFYQNTQEFIAAISGRRISFRDETILIKGARSFGFEKISKLLKQKKHQTELEINLNAVVHNLKAYQQLLKPGVRTMVMVKAFSYGSGNAEIAGLLQFYRVDYLAVANVDEGIDLRKSGITIPVLVLNPDPEYFEDLIIWKLEPELYSINILNAFNEKVRQQGISDYPVHIKLDTGMHRLGFSQNQLPELISFLHSDHTLKITSVFSHLAASENSDMDDFTNQQATLFEKMSTKITSALPYPVLRHLSNTSGISRHPHLQYDMVRLGIGLYGIDHAMKDTLQLVHTLRTTISQIKEIKKGESIGYGRAEKVNSDRQIATVALGYADGYLRSLGLGKSQMNIQNKLVPTIGQICMDMLMLDITDVPAKEGDAVVVFGEKPTIQQLAENGNTIPYEILTGLSQRIVRVYIQE